MKEKITALREYIEKNKVSIVERAYWTIKRGMDNIIKEYMLTEMKDIIEGNILIADFMGFNKWNEKCPIDPYDDKSEKEIVHAGYLNLDVSKFPTYSKNQEHNPPVCRLENLKFHTSWEWLMNVVDEIESLGYYSVMSSEETGKKRYIFRIMEYGTTERQSHSKWYDSKIEAVWNESVNFIKKRNERKNGSS